MTKRELIAAMKDMPDDADVRCYDDYFYWYSITAVELEEDGCIYFSPESGE